MQCCLNKSYLVPLAFPKTCFLHDESTLKARFKTLISSLDFINPTSFFQSKNLTQVKDQAQIIMTQYQTLNVKALLVNASRCKCQ